MEQWIKKEQSKQEASNISSNYEVDTVLSTLILGIVNDLQEERNKLFFKALSAIAIRTSSLLSLQLLSSGLTSFSEFASIEYEKLIVDLHSRINFHESTK